jgi:hypothetical protein
MEPLVLGIAAVFSHQGTPAAGDGPEVTHKNSLMKVLYSIVE